jgi:radical SAM superfamily enzyme YgiQ (UPF0313 family)
MLLATSLEVIEASYHDSLNAAYPLGLAYLHAYLEKLGHQVITLDLSESPVEACETAAVAMAEKFLPEIIGFQMLTSTRASVLKVAETLKQRRKNAYVVLGGVHATEMCERLLRQYPDYLIVLKEGELSFSSLIKAIEDRNDLSSVPGIAFMRNQQLITTGPGPVIENLDILPFPRHDLFIEKTSRFASLMTSRGCPFTCSFCSVARRPMRFRSVNNVVDEIEYIQKTFPQIHTIRIWDDQFFYKLDRVIEICDEIVRRSIHMKFICLGRLKPISRELVLALERAGFIHVLFGLESGSSRVLERCNKKIKPSDAIRAAQLFSESSIEISMFLIVGLEGETEETILETAALVQDIQKISYFPGWSNVGIATVYPGTDLYERALSTGWIREDFWDNLNNSAPLFTLEHPYERLEEFLHLLLDYIDPIRILRSREAFVRQRHLIPHIIRWVYRNLGRTDNPYRLRHDLAPFMNLAAKVVHELESRGTLRVVLGKTLKDRINDGTALVTSVRRQPGVPGTYVFDAVPVDRSNLLAYFLRDVSLGGSEEIFSVLCSGIDQHLAHRHGVDEPAIATALDTEKRTSSSIEFAT